MTEELRRRDVLLGGGAVAGMSLLQAGALAQSGPTNETLIPWIDQPPPVPPAAKALKALTRSEELDSWITPNDKFFCIAHYDVPAIDEKSWRLEIAGLVAKPLTLRSFWPNQRGPAVVSGRQCSDCHRFGPDLSTRCQPRRIAKGDHFRATLTLRPMADGHQQPTGHADADR